MAQSPQRSPDNEVDKKANRSKKAHWPDLERSLRTWVLQEQAEGRGLSTVQLHLKAKTNAVGFNGGPSWCFRFMRRNQLVMRARTTVYQKLPDDFQTQLERFSSFVREEVAKNNVSTSHIVNMDEVPLTFDIPLGRSVAEKGQKTVTVRTTGHEKSHFTVVLACCADGTKLPPMLTFKRETLPKDIFPPTVVIQANTKGWMDEEMMVVWLDRCFSRRPDRFFHVKPGMLAGLIACVADVEESDSSESEDDSDVPGVQREIAALFVSDSEEDDFDGFDETLPSHPPPVDAADPASNSPDGVELPVQSEKEEVLSHLETVNLVVHAAQLRLTRRRAKVREALPLGTSLTFSLENSLFSKGWVSIN
ncbi:hypothetical protein MTO96_042709 [Rhipicephalus appendiculatus]